MYYIIYNLNLIYNTQRLEIIPRRTKFSTQKLKFCKLNKSRVSYKPENPDLKYEAYGNT